MNNFLKGRKTKILLKILRFNYLIVMSSIHLRRFKTNIFHLLIKELSTKDSGTIPKDLKNLYFLLLKTRLLLIYALEERLLKRFCGIWN